MNGKIVIICKIAKGNGVTTPSTFNRRTYNLAGKKHYFCALSG